MLVEDCQQAETAVLRLDRLRTEARRSNDYTVRRERLEEVAKMLRSVAVPASIMRRIGIAVPAQTRAISQLRQFATQVQEELLKNPEVLIEPNRYDFTGFARNAVAVTDEIRPQLQNLWRQWVESHGGAPDEELLTLLSRIGQFSGPIREIREISGQLAALALRLPASDADVNRVRSLAERLIELLNAVRTSDVSDEVWEFLRASGGRSGAGLDLLTPRVLTWLNENGVKQRFAIMWKA